MALTGFKSTKSLIYVLMVPLGPKHQMLPEYKSWSYGEKWIHWYDDVWYAVSDLDGHIDSLLIICHDYACLTIDVKVLSSYYTYDHVNS